MTVGRPSKYNPEFVAQAAKLCALGATDVEIADFFEVSVATLNRWKAEHDDFCASIKAAKEIADDRVERSLYQRAIGYEHDDTDIRVIGGEIVQTTIRKYYPPDTGACAFWLKNRRKNEWRDKVETGVTDTEGKDVAVDPLEAARRIAFLLTQGARKLDGGDV